MAKSKAKAKPVAVNEPTPERMRHDPSVMVAAAFGHGPRTVDKVRQFRITKVDQLYADHKITHAQHAAANWWRGKVEDGLGLPRVVADYGQSTGGGSRDPSPIPITDKAELARKALDAARGKLSPLHRMWVEDALADPHPRIVGRAVENRRNRWRSGLQALAIYLKLDNCIIRV